jgi:hypothetical protein
MIGATYGGVRLLVLLGFPDAMGASRQGAEDRLGELVERLLLQGLAGSLATSLAAALEDV